MNMKISLSNIGIFLGKFYLLGLLDGATNDYVSILYADDNSKPLLEIDGNSLPWEEYVKYFGGEQIFCCSCGIMILKEKKSQRYCTNCGKIKKREKAKERKQRQRKREKKVTLDSAIII